MNDYSDVRQIIEDIKNLEKTNPELREYFKNQQRFIHLYLLSKGASVTAELINDVISTLDRGFAPKTYYSLRRELNDMEWIEEDETIKSSNVKGPVEVSHRIKRNRLNEFQKKMIEEINIVDRPFSMNKNHLFEMGLRFSKLNRQKIGELESYIKKYLNTEDSFVFPTFLTKSISNELIKAYHSISYMEYIGSFLGDFIKKAKDIPIAIRDQVIQILTVEPKPIWALGKKDKYLDSTPFLYTALRDIPKFLSWQKDDNAEEYEIVLLDHVKETKICEPIRCIENKLEIPDSIQIKSGIYYEWHVFSIQKGSKNLWFRGIFWLFPEEDHEQLSKDEKDCFKIDDIGVQKVAVSNLYITHQLYDEAINILSDEIEKEPNSKETIPFRTTLISLYKEVYDILNEAESSEANRIRDLANEEVKKITCLHLGNYAIYEDEGCKKCNECGFIDQQECQ